MMNESAAIPAQGQRRKNRLYTVLCGWTLEELLGGGPVSESWLGVRGNEPPAVVRVLREPFAEDEQARAEWLGASWAANRFHHAHVPPILRDGADEQGAPVVVRRWVKGRSLDQVARSGPVELAVALRFAEHLLDALEMAHAHGILHGALTPSNVIVTGRASAHLVDFATTPGLLSRHGGPLVRARVSSFVSPEQRVPAPPAPTIQSDVWAAGACLYFMLARTPPADGAVRLPAASANEDVIAVLERALAADPIHRYESAYAMLGDIRHLMAGRKPRLQDALAQLPSQSPTELQTRSTAEPFKASDAACDDDATAPVAPATREITPVPPRPSEWQGNLLLVAAIALLVAVATFVLQRERLADAPLHATPAASP